MDIVCLGEALIDFVALETGVNVGQASGFIKAPGGAPANVAVGVVRLGGASAFLGKVGDDPFGHFLADTFAHAGVDVSGVRYDSSARTGLAFVSIEADGERSFSFYRNPSADMLYAPEELDTALIQRCKVFHFGSITLIGEPSRSATLAAVDIARKAGKIVSYDPNLRERLWPNLDAARVGMRQPLDLVDVVKVSEEELAFITGETDVHDGIDSLMMDYPNLRIVAVSMGANGCAWCTRKGDCSTTSAPNVTPIDTTGAGDGFVAGMLTQLLKHARTPQELDSLGSHVVGTVFRYANAVGALTTTKKGAIPALPTDAEVVAFMHDLPAR